MSTHRWQIEVEEAGLRLELLVARRLPGLPRAEVRRLFAEGRVRAGRRGAAKGEPARAGELLTVDLAGLGEELAVVPEPAASLRVVLETVQVVVADKPAGQPSAPLRPGERGTLANALVARYPEMAGLGCSPREPGLLHRLDTGTSGLIAAARTAEAFAVLRGALQQGRLDKAYLLICLAAGLEGEGRIELPLAPEPRGGRRVRACHTADEVRRYRARPASTRFRILGVHGPLALVEARASPALRHQLRVHFAAIGHPLAGDELYGGPQLPGLARHALHASRIAWPGGEGVAPFAATSELPPDLAGLLR